MYTGRVGLSIYYFSPPFPFIVLQKMNGVEIVIEISKGIWH